MWKHGLGKQFTRSFMKSIFMHNVEGTGDYPNSIYYKDPTPLNADSYINAHRYAYIYYMYRVHSHKSHVYSWFVVKDTESGLL